MSRENGKRTPEQTLAAVRLHAATLDDLERSRKALGNRVGATLRRAGVPKATAKRIVTAVKEGGVEKLSGDDRLTLANFAMDDVLSSFSGIVGLEADVEKMLVRAWRHHPLAPWAKSVQGVGDKSIARLVAEIGDPRVRVLGEWRGEGEKREWVGTGHESRTFAQLSQYVGHGDPRRRRRARQADGTRMSQEEALALGNPAAKMRVYLIAEAGIKGGCRACRAASRERKEAEGEALPYAPPPADCTCAETHPLRHAYNVARAKYQTKTYTEEDVPRKKTPGDPWSAAHQHAAARRIVAKTFLAMLWKASGAVSLDPVGGRR